VENSQSGVQLESRFVRKRNALLLTARLESLFVDFYLHLAELKESIPSGADGLFKDLLAAFTLHLGVRPRNESIAWTVNLQKPLMNLFITGDNHQGAVVGRIFAENVKEGGANMLYSKQISDRGPQRTSVISFDHADPFHAAEVFYRQSEQRPARYFDLGDELYAMVSAQPECDMPWFESLNVETVRRIEEMESCSLLETRFYHWSCGCTVDRMYEVLLPTMRENAEGLFEGEASVRIDCPRCGVRYVVTREALEAYMAEIVKNRRNNPL
jgi:molecular chaperone Hsp33